MKKTLTILIALIAVVLTSCTKKYETITPNQTIFLTAQPADWRTTDGSRTFSASFNMPEIDNYFNDNGAVLVYASFDNGVWEQIPEVYKGISYSYSHSRGNLYIDIQSSNGTGVIGAPTAAIRFKVVLVESMQ
jgi:hypothetical protein